LTGLRIITCSFQLRGFEVFRFNAPAVEVNFRMG